MKLSGSPSLSLSAAISSANFLRNGLWRTRAALVALSLVALSAAWHSPAARAQAVDFGSVNVCPSGATTPAPCSKTLSVIFKIAATGTLGTPKVLTTGAPNLDYTLATGSTCLGAVVEGATCTVKVTLAPRYAGERKGAVQIVNESGTVVATALIRGVGVAPQIAFDPGVETQILSGFEGQPFQDARDLAVDDLGNVYLISDDQYVFKVPAGGGESFFVGAGLEIPEALALDGAGDVFITNNDGDYPSTGSVVVVSPDGSQSTLPFTGLSEPNGIAVDGFGNAFVADYNNSSSIGSVLELPAGSSDQTALPFTGLSYPLAVAVDNLGDVFVSDGIDYSQTLELLADGGGQKSLPFREAGKLAVDAAGDVFTDDGSGIIQLPAGASTPIRITLGGDVYNVAVNAAGDVFTFTLESTPYPLLIFHRSQPPSLSFLASEVGIPSTDSPQSVQIQNAGNATLSLRGLSLSGDFALVPGPGTPADCTASSSLAPGAQCNLSISFTPEMEGPLTGVITLTDNALNAAGATQEIQLSGTGLSPDPKLSVSATTLAFGNLALGQQKDLSLQLTNVGVVPVTLSPVINGPSFTIPSAENGCPTVIPAGHTCTFSVRFLPRTFGGHLDTLNLTGPGVTAPTVQLTGQTLGVGAELGLLNFGTIPYGKTAILSVPVVNYAVAKNVTFSTSINGSSFQVLTAGNTCLTGVTAAQQCMIPVEFSPPAYGNYDAVLTITASSGDVSLVKLNGAGN
jgi:hypothetical protein